MASRPLASQRMQFAPPGMKQGLSQLQPWLNGLWAIAPKALLVSVGYYAGTKLGFALTPEAQPIATFWPPNAILLAALLLTPLRTWWIFVLAVLPAHLAAQFEAGIPLVTALGWFLGNTGEALLGAWSVRWWSRGRPLFDSVCGVTAFLVFGVIVAPLATSFVDVATVVATGWGRGYWVLWTARMFSNMLAVLTLVPTIVTVGSKGASWIRKTDLSRCAEAVLLSLGVLMVSGLVFGGDNPSQTSIPALVYAPLPLLLWASVRFGSGGLGMSLTAVALVSVWNAMQGRGPFVSASTAENVLSLQVLLLAIGVPLLVLTAVMAERRGAEELLRTTSGKLFGAQEEERHRIARELHDDIGQRLALVEMDLTQLRSESGAAHHLRLGRLAENVSAVSKATREMSHELHPVAIDHLGLAPALRSLCREFGQGQPFAVRLQLGRIPASLPREVSLCFYRVAQEALHNAAKHSRARSVVVELEADRGRMRLRVTDDGVGFASSERSPAGLGFASMRERLRAVGGTMVIVSAPRTGTTIEAHAPLQRTAAAGSSS